MSDERNGGNMENTLQAFHSAYPRAATIADLQRVTKFARHLVDQMLKEGTVVQVNRKKTKVPDAYLLVNPHKTPDMLVWQAIRVDHLHLRAVIPQFQAPSPKTRVTKRPKSSVSPDDLPDTFI